MALEMVLNELSLQPAPSVVIARQWMAGFIETVRAATSHRVSRVVRTSRCYPATFECQLDYRGRDY